jgi:3D (Asp-Asp-Asp) domain-containing protein
MFNVSLKRFIRFLFLLLVFDLACFSSTVLHQPQSEIIAQESKLVFKDTVITQAPTGNMKYLGKFKVTFYWIVEESDYSGAKNTPLYLENGSVLGYFPSSFVSDLKKEACAELKGGKCISYMKRVNKVRIVREFLGVNGFTISPLKSVAVDPSIIPIGSKLHIPALTQMNSYSHNGTVYAHDIGSMINGHSIDIFVGYKSNTKLLTDAGIESSSLVDVYLLE